MELSSVSSILFLTNQSGTNKYQQLYHAFLGSIRTKFSIKILQKQPYQFSSLKLIRNRINYKRTNINSFITHFLSKLYCRRAIINSFITFFDFYNNLKQILMHENNYQPLYHKFFDLCNSHE